MIYAVLAVVACLQLSNTYIYNGVSTDNRPWSLPLYLTIVILSNLLWFYLAKSINDKGKLMTIGFIWDLQAIVAVIVIPIIFFSFRPSLYFWAGAAICVLGILIMKTNS